jgi:hypothetical protein
MWEKCFCGVISRSVTCYASASRTARNGKSLSCSDGFFINAATYSNAYTGILREIMF